MVNAFLCRVGDNAAAHLDLGTGNAVHRLDLLLELGRQLGKVAGCGETESDVDLDLVAINRYVFDAVGRDQVLIQIRVNVFLDRRFDLGCDTFDILYS